VAMAARTFEFSQDAVVECTHGVDCRTLDAQGPGRSDGHRRVWRDRAGGSPGRVPHRPGRLIQPGLRSTERRLCGSTPLGDRRLSERRDDVCAQCLELVQRDHRFVDLIDP
jgi:hypothetical protein